MKKDNYNNLIVDQFDGDDCIFELIQDNIVSGGYYVNRLLPDGKRVIIAKFYTLDNDSSLYYARMFFDILRVKES